MAQSEVFVDTSGFLALWDASDAHHQAAVQLQKELIGKRRRFLTSDYVLDESITLLKARHSQKAACDFIRAVSATQMVTVEWLGSDRFEAAAEFFVRHSDKEWSFTDCASFVIMRERKLEQAFTTDHHFRQAGFDAMLKP